MITLVIINTFLCAATVLIHYEALSLLTRFLNFWECRRRMRILTTVFGSLSAHIVEIWMFALAYYWMEQYGGFGGIRGVTNGSLMDCAYFSFSTYSSLGYGDVEPYGPLRFLAGMQVITGLVMISWTSSFVFIEMQRHWGKA